MYFNDLEELDDILDLIDCDSENDDYDKDNQFSVFTEEEEIDIINTIMELLYVYIDENPREITEPDFHENIIDEVRDFLIMNTPELYAKNTDVDKVQIDNALDDMFDTAIEIFFNSIIPPRSYPNTFIRKIPSPHDIKWIQKQIDYLANKPQPEQRTPEWYIFRHNLITASNAYKAFENQSSQNQLIYEKCKPINMESRNGFVNVDSPLHWGQKYEPLSVMLYERDYNTHVGDFGCIQHEKYSFLGASPDGINNDPSKPERFGRMLEIKNIVNREIDGIPKKEYWVQMQLQMETCNLDECDFLETRFTEYEKEVDFFNDCEADTDDSFLYTKDNNPKGIILYFSTNEGRPLYIYKPLNMNQNEFEKWEAKTINDLTTIDETGKQQNIWIKNIYWKLDEMSCVLVVRNKKWFHDNIFQLQQIWNIIEKERVEGYEHRAPNKRIKKVEPDNIMTNNNTIDKFFDLGQQFTKNKNQPQPQPQQQRQTGCLIRIRTESIDETKNNL